MKNLGKMMKRCLAFFMALCMIVCLWNVPVSVASYTSDYRCWSQYNSDYQGMREVGCLIVAQAKMLYEAGVNRDASFNPDAWYNWLLSNQFIESSTNLNMKDHRAPEYYARVCGKKLTMMGTDWDSNEQQFWFNINAGYYTIVKVPGTDGEHWVMIANELSKQTGTLYCYDSYSTSHRANPRPLSVYGVYYKSIVYAGSNGSAPNPQPVTQSPSIAVDTSNGNWHVDDNNIVPCAKIYNPNRSRVSTVGIQIRDGATVIAQKEEQMTTAGQYSATSKVWFNCISECGVRLRAGHTYTWQIYAYVGGKYITTNWQTIKTTGSEKPNTPVLSSSKKDYAVGDAVTVSWGADFNATKGYALTITQIEGGTYTKTLTTSSYNATSLAFTLPKVGKYKITGYACGSTQNSGVATLNKTIEAHAPSVVRFVELNQDGEENLLSEQTIAYGYAAQAPTGITRKGHRFTGWKGEYSCVTSDRTIVAQFKKNTYKITFVDKDGNTIETQSVLFEEDATPPTPPEAETGYVFAGWDSNAYVNVQGNATIKASYVWANDDLPVVITLNKCEFKDDGYIINYNIKNNPNKRTKGRALVSLMTSKKKLLDTTESNAFSLSAGEEKKGLEIFVPYEGVATKASLYIINGFSKGIPISEVATVDVERNWSNWSEEQPDEDNEVESRTEYRYQDKELTTTRTSNNAGWTLYNTVLDSNWSYGAWSGYSRSAYSSYVNTTNRRDVETRSVQDSAAYTLYNWYYYRYWNTAAGQYYYTYSSSMGGTRYDWQTNYCLPQIGTYSGHAGYKPAGGKNFSNEIWFLASTQNVGASYHTEWRYRDATKGYTYYWYRWKPFTDWSATEVSATDARKVETRTTYRYRAKMEDIEDNSGTVQETSGTLDKSLAGKQATLLVYKNEAPSDSNNEYVGQCVIGEDGNYNFTYITRESISAKTGDYTVALAIEGAENPIYVDTIKAPKPVYTVTFKDDEGNIIDTQKVSEGESASAPKTPEKEHYHFIGWDYGFTNVRDDMEITAQYAKNKYSVAFVNWETKEVETSVFSYGDPITYPEVSEIEGYDFTKWTTLDGEVCETVTDNVVLMANYEIQTYTIRFYDKDEALISSQKVVYGEDATAPTAPTVDKMVFKSWNSYGFIQVKSDLDVYPVYEYIETTSDPSCDTQSGVFTETKTIHLSAEKGAKIYYTTDGTMPTIASQVYDGKLVIDKNTFLQYIAVAPDKNVSNVKNIAFLVSSGEDDEGALVIKKENYNLERGKESKITYFLSHSDSAVGVNFYSLDESIASVDEDGVIHANQVGETQIFASTTDSRYADYCNVKVTTNEIDAESVSLDKTAVIGMPDETIQIAATIYPDNATDQDVDWYIDDESVATVTDDGEVTILKKGMTTLRAVSKTGTCYAECNIEGTVGYAEDKLQISLPYLLLAEGQTDTLYTFYGGALVQCNWSSSNPKVVSVKDGLVTAKTAGQSIVSATTEDGTEVTCVVVVSRKEEASSSEEVITTESPTTQAPTTQVPTTVEQTNAQGEPTTSTSVTNESDVLTDTVDSVPEKVQKITVSNSQKKTITVKWKHTQEIDGYQLQYSTKRSFSKKTTKSMQIGANKATIKKRKKKTYYVRVRAFRYINTKKVYGKWSTVKKVKVKK